MRRCRSPIAIDFGEHSVTALQLESRAGVLRVRAARRERLPVDDGALRAERWQRAAATALRGGGFRGNEAVIALGLAEVATPHVRVPVEELEQAGERITAQLQTHASGGAGLAITPLPIVDLFDQGTRKREYLCCVARVETIDARVALVERLKLRPQVIELAPLAQLRPLLRLAPQESFVHVDFGANETRVTVVRGGEPVTMRAVPVGGEALRAAVETRLGLPLATVDALGMPDAPDPQALADSVAKALAEPLAPVVRRIAEGIRYCGALFHGRAVTALRATGAAAWLPGLVPWLARHVGISSEAVDPFHDIHAGPLAAASPAVRAGYTTALGLALGGLDA
jgi:Tfp pilus assembly PilM family ATPase